MRPQFQVSELGSLLETVIDYRGKTPKKLKGSWSASGVPALSAKNIKAGKIVSPESIRYVDQDLYKRWMREEVCRGDILMTSEAPLGETYYVNNEDKILLSQRLFAIRSDKKKLDSRFLFYYLNTEMGRHELLSRATGTTVGGIRQTALMKVRVRYPTDVMIQKEIASVLASYDELIGNNEERIQILENMAQVLYRQLTVNPPTGSSFKNLGDVAQDIRDIVNPKELESGTYYVGLEHIPRKTIALTDWGQASEVKSSKLKFLKGDILFGKIRPYFHKVVSAPIDGIASSDAVIIRAENPLMQAMVLLCVSSERFVAFATKNSQGTKMPRADWKNMSKYPILIPGEKALTGFSARVNDLVAQINVLMFENRRLSELRNALVPQLVSGKVALKHAVQQKAEVTATLSPYQDAVTFSLIVKDLRKTYGKNPSRFEVQKNKYFVDRYFIPDIRTKYSAMPNGPYDKASRYKGGESIAIKSGYISKDGDTKFGVGHDIGKAERYYSNKLSQVEPVLSYVRAKSDEELEILTTTDYAIFDLVSTHHKKVTAIDVLEYISNHSIWKEKVQRLKLTEEKIAKFMTSLKEMSSLGIRYPQI